MTLELKPMTTYAILEYPIYIYPFYLYKHNNVY